MKKSSKLRKAAMQVEVQLFIDPAKGESKDNYFNLVRNLAITLIFENWRRFR